MKYLVPVICGLMIPVFIIACIDAEVARQERAYTDYQTKCIFSSNCK